MDTEVLFASVLESFQLLLSEGDPFDVIREFKAIAARKALDCNLSNADAVTFENWDLETRLWHLVELLYGLRHSGPAIPLPEYPSSSFHVKKENWLRSNPHLRELSVIIYWLQTNSKSVAVSDDMIDFSGKWQNTRVAVENSDLSTLAQASSASKIVSELDPDAPLRSGLKIDKNDDLADSKVFSLIYKLVLANDIPQAIELANKTSNFTLSLILLGAQQEFLDPTMDKETLLHENDMLIEELVESASGLKHKLLWLKTVAKLSQQTNINPYEKLIYNYLSGVDISSNIKAAPQEWEEHLLLYLNLLLTHSLAQFLGQKASDLDSIPVTLPTPQLSTVSGVLNALLNTDTEVSEQSKHPIRILIGSVMINQISSFLHNEMKSTTSTSRLAQNPHLLRIFTHLTIFLSLVEGPSASLSTKDVNKIITLYVSKLQESGFINLVPTYLSFIPDEKNARECYSLFLSSVTDPLQRQEQISIARKFNVLHNFNDSASQTSMSSSTDDFNESEGRFVNVLRRTVERVMTETAPYYKSKPGSPITVDATDISYIDSKLLQTVDWFFQSKTYEDAISASIVVLRRFLLNGKLASLKKFGEGKDFKMLIKQYDAEYQTKLLSSSNEDTVVTEEMKEELLQYSSLLEVLKLIDDWKTFLKDNKINGTSNAVFWKSNDIAKSIEKTSSSISDLIYKWLKNLITSSSLAGEDVKILEEFRCIYIPYLMFELISIYQVSRLNDWKYMRLAFKLISEVVKEDENDFLSCFLRCGRLNEFVQRSGEIAVVASERGVKGIFI